MKTLKYILTVTIGILLLASCEQEDHLFDESMSAVGFYGSTATMQEYDKDMSGKDSVTIQFLVTALTDAPSCNITFEVDTVGIKNPAVEGVDFETITDKTVTVSEGWGYLPMSLAAIDNNDYDEKGNKSFRLKVVSNSLDYDLSSEYYITITIIDDDHPLGWMFGDYLVSTPETRNGSTSHAGSITAVLGETSKIKIYGMAGSAYGPALADPYFILATVSDDHTTVTIDAGQEWESWAYGSTILTAWEDDNGEGEETDKIIATLDKSGPVVLTISQQFTFMITDGSNEGLGLQWSWNSDAAANSPTSTWTKQ